MNTSAPPPAHDRLFPPTTVLEPVRLTLGGLSCAGCARRIERTLQQTPGVISVRVNFANETASVVGTASSDTLVDAVEHIGFTANPVDSVVEGRNARQQAQAAQAQRDRKLLMIAVLFSTPLVLPMLLHPLGVRWELPGWTQCLLAMVIQGTIGARIYAGAWQAVRHRGANMDVLVALGTTAALGLSIYGLITDGPLYFESSALILTLILSGKFIERRAKQQTTEALDGLSKLYPTRASLETPDGTVEVPIEAVGTNTTVVVRPGEHIPVDGTIISGTSTVDESLLTGESMPVGKHEGDQVLTGALNHSGMLRVRTTHVGHTSRLAQIVAVVERAQAEKASVERTIDRVSAVFVPTVVLLAICTGGGWWALGLPPTEAVLRAVAVLVVACPCALGLATPTVIAVGLGTAARAGILIRRPAAMEKALRLSAVVLDKTGTLTLGVPKVRNTWSFPESIFSEERLLELAAQTQAGSEHPLARAVVQAWQSHPSQTSLGSAPSELVAVPGRGVIATLRGSATNSLAHMEVAIGSPQWMAERGHNLVAHKNLITSHQRVGTVMLIEIDHKLCGGIAVEDPLRPSTPSAIEALHRANLKVILLTGDNRHTAETLAKELRITDVESEILPEAKAECIQRLQADGHRVVMVGDGINDAPALSVANLSIAMGTGTDLAKQAADITLMKADPQLVLAAIDIAQQMHVKLHHNIFWVFTYNLLGLPLAAAGLLTPILAGTMMALSSISVVSNALLLRRWQPPTI
ncbi:MAG: cation-translocating P-type ATPase [Myxococcales bacterium]|nr:cation-translocating P-type ATPase [Myxococcales bacterium]